LRHGSSLAVGSADDAVAEAEAEADADASPDGASAARSTPVARALTPSWDAALDPCVALAEASGLEAEAEIGIDVAAESPADGEAEALDAEDEVSVPLDAFAAVSVPFDAFATEPLGNRSFCAPSSNP
jgi:hypothetical protein